MAALHLYLPDHTMAEVDAVGTLLAERTGLKITRSAAIRWLIERAMASTDLERISPHPGEGAEVRPFLPGDADTGP